jgi:membrane protease YdiL (CAAX protease family)
VDDRAGLSPVPGPEVDPGPITVATEPTHAPPGWFADPWRIGELRWWDGNAWSEYVFPAVSLPREQPPKGPGIRGGGVAGIGAALGTVASLAVSIVIAIVMGGGAVSPWFELLAELPLWAGFLGAAVFASRRNGSGRLAADYGISAPNVGDVGLGVLGGLAGRVISVLFIVLVVIEQHLSDSSTSLPQSILGITPQGFAGWTVLIVLTVVGAPIIEEIFFRGLIQGAFSRRIGPVAALFVTAVIFSLSHVPGEGPFAPFQLFPMALVLGYLRMKTGRLAAGMLAHAEFNAIGLAIVLIPALH